jgi:hypothetical protein
MEQKKGPENNKYQEKLLVKGTAEDEICGIKVAAPFLYSLLFPFLVFSMALGIPFF